MKNFQIAKIFKTSIVITVSTLFTLNLFSCGDKNKDAERGGAECLLKARKALKASDFKAAREAIDTLRIKFPLAFNAREEGILLLDSIEIFQAKTESVNLDMKLKSLPANAPKDSVLFDKEHAQLKIKFFTRKLSHDKANFKRH